MFAIRTSVSAASSLFNRLVILTTRFISSSLPNVKTAKVSAKISSWLFLEKKSFKYAIRRIISCGKPIIIRIGATIAIIISISEEIVPIIASTVATIGEERSG